MRELQRSLTLMKNRPFFVMVMLSDPHRYYDDELRSIGFWFGMIPGPARRMLETAGCPPGL